MNPSTINDIDFQQLFQSIAPEFISDNVFTLAYSAITAGKQHHYNSMIGSGGGFGLFFKKPSTWSLLKSDRYTLELIQKEQSFTLSYFPRQYNQQALFLGSESGRNTAKMEEVELTSVQLPSGNISYAEARLILECNLTAITTPSPEDFYSPEALHYLAEAYKEPSDHRKIVFGEITHAWVKR